MSIDRNNSSSLRKKKVMNEIEKKAITAESVRLTIDEKAVLIVS